jgi:hypothetical protein
MGIPVLKFAIALSKSCPYGGEPVPWEPATLNVAFGDSLSTNLSSPRLDDAEGEV